MGAFAVEPEAPAVETADDFLRLTAAGGQPSTAMRADIVEGADPAVLVAQDDDRLIGDLVGDILAGVRDLLLAAGHLPDPRPEVFRLQLGELAADVSVLGNEIRTDF